MKVSVIIPLLNVGEYVEECLNSVISQTLKEMEIICVDGGSTDGTLQILERFAQMDARIQVVHSEKKSYGYQMNLGLQRATGEYIAIVEPDDWIEPDMMKSLYEIINAKKADFIKGGITEFIGDTQVMEQHFFTQEKVLPWRENISLEKQRNMIQKLPTTNCTGLFLRKFLMEKNIFFHETPGASYQDLGFSVLVGMLGDTCIYDPRGFYHYRMDNANSSIHSLGKMKCVKEEYQYIEQELMERGQFTEEKRNILWKMKLATYDWNYRRLQKEKRKEFLQLISDEMMELKNKELNLSPQEKEIFSRLFDENGIEEFAKMECEVQKNTKALIKEIKAGMQYYVISAGKNFDMLCMINKMLGMDCILAVADNSEKLQGQEKNGHIITSVEHLLERKQKGIKWLIINKRYCQELKDQLIKGKVPEENIVAIDQIVPLEMIMHYIGEDYE